MVHFYPYCPQWTRKHLHLAKNILQNPPYYDKDQFTDKSERFFVNEAIREKILLNYEKEIPYSVEVVTEQFKENEGIIFIDTVIYVERETQKGILIGHKGEAIKKVGTQARLDLEQFFGKKIHLNLFVKVKKDWRKNERDLKNFGYRWFFIIDNQYSIYFLEKSIQKIFLIEKKVLYLHHWKREIISWRDGRVVECGGLENRWL